MPPKKADVFCSRCGAICKNGRRHFGRNKHTFCSMECYISYKSKKIDVTCDNCGIIFSKKRSAIKRTNHNFCSHACEIDYRHKHSATKKKYYRINNQLVHRAIAEEKIGRKLLPFEQVHHIDGDARNNDPANLMIVTAQEHSRIHAMQKRRNPLGQFVAKTNTP